MFDLLQATKYLLCVVIRIRSLLMFIHVFKSFTMFNPNVTEIKLKKEEEEEC